MKPRVEEPVRSRWFEGVAIGGVLALFVVMLAGYFVPTYEGTDENGYLLTGKRLAVAGDMAKRTSDPFEFISGNWVETQPGVYYAKYPIGYPALLALAYRLGGEEAVFWVNPILATLAVLGVFLLGRALWNPVVGVLAALLLATNSLHAYFGLSALSHSGAMCCAVWAMWFLWRWWERGGRWNALLAGALAAYGISIRYTEALLFLPVAVAVVWRARSGPPVGRDVAWMLAGGAVTILPLVAQHWVAYGSPFVTGYTLCQESTGFGWKWFRENWWWMLQRLSGPGLGWVFPLGLAGLTVLCFREPRRGVWLAAWTWPALLVYSAYYWAPQGEGPGYARFFVSVFPALTLGAVGLVWETARPGAMRPVVVGLVVLTVATLNLRDTTKALDKRLERFVFSRATAEAVRATLPTGTVIFAPAHLLNHVEYWGQYRLYAQETFERGAIANQMKVLDHDDPHPMQREKVQRIANLLGGKQDGQLTALQRARIERHLGAGRRVVLLTNADGYRRWRGRVGEWFALTPLTEWMEVQTAPKDEVRRTLWGLYELRPRAAAAAVASVQEELDRLECRLRTLREQFRDQHPGAQEQWTQITAVEREARELREQLKKIKALAQGERRKPGTT